MENTLPSVTVATVTYNAEKTLQATLESVAAQTYPHVEHLIIDGCSKDRTMELIHRYVDDDLVSISAVTGFAINADDPDTTAVETGSVTVASGSLSVIEFGTATAVDFTVASGATATVYSAGFAGDVTAALSNYGAMLQGLAYGIEQHHGYSLGILTYAKRADSGQHHERELAEHILLPGRLPGFVRDGKPYGQKSRRVPHRRYPRRGKPRPTGSRGHHADHQHDKRHQRPPQPGLAAFVPMPVAVTATAIVPAAPVRIGTGSSRCFLTMLHSVRLLSSRPRPGSAGIGLLSYS